MSRLPRVLREEVEKKQLPKRVAALEAAVAELQKKATVKPDKKEQADASGNKD